MLIASLQITIGFALLIFGADFLVKGSVATANKLKISPLIIGLTVVAFGTSAPELVVSLNAALSGFPGISIGNVVGSNIANIMLVLGVTAFVSAISTNKIDFKNDYIVMSMASLILLFGCIYGTFTKVLGMTMVLLLIYYINHNYRAVKKSQKLLKEQEEEVKELAGFDAKPNYIIAIAIIFGLAGIVYGADVLITGASDLARMFNISEEVIGLTIVAIGTSLPELATSFVAAMKKQNEVAIGNIIGSNIWNILFIMGTTSSIVEIPVPKKIVDFDIWFMMLISLLLYPLLKKNNQLSRTRGAILFFGYIGYTAYQYISR